MPKLMPWHVVLIVEDDTDGRACRELARAAGIRATIDWLPANGIGNIKRKASSLITLARDRFKKRGCAAAFLRKTGHPYRKGRARLEIAKRARGPDPRRNSSLAEGIRYLSKCKVL